jgi:hypothetical protein
MPELFVEQGRSTGMKLLELVRNENSQVGVQMRITLDWLQQTAGVSFSKLEKPEKRTPHLEDTWLKTLTDFLHDSNCAITIPGTYKVQLRRKEDANLMERVAIMANYADGAMKQIDTWRFPAFFLLHCMRVPVVVEHTAWLGSQQFCRSMACLHCRRFPHLSLSALEVHTS